MSEGRLGLPSPAAQINTGFKEQKVNSGMYFLGSACPNCEHSAEGTPAACVPSLGDGGSTERVPAGWQRVAHMSRGSRRDRSHFGICCSCPSLSRDPRSRPAAE